MERYVPSRVRTDLAEDPGPEKHPVTDSRVLTRENRLGGLTRENTLDTPSRVRA
jgi:hypothetical protein